MTWLTHLLRIFRKEERKPFDWAEKSTSDFLLEIERELEAQHPHPRHVDVPKRVHVHLHHLDKS